MCISQFSAGFEFNNDLIIDKEIKPVKADFRIAVIDWYGELSRKRYFLMTEFNCKSIFIDCLKEPWAKRFVNRNSGADDLTSKFFMCERHFMPLSWFHGFLIQSSFPASWVPESLSILSCGYRQAKQVVSII